MIDNGRVDRRPLAGEVDFTMMYVAHDAFSRHLGVLESAAAQGGLLTSGGSARWALFKKQLHTHHTTEDASLWPRLRAAVSASDEVAVLDAMEAEHAQIDPLLERVDAALAGGADAEAAASLHDLRTSLGAHMRHEEDEALPLVETHLGASGWAAFAQDIRRRQGIRGAATYFPWLLDGSPEATSRKLLRVLPPPIRLVHRLVWEPRYRKLMS